MLTRKPLRDQNISTNEEIPLITPSTDFFFGPLHQNEAGEVSLGAHDFVRRYPNTPKAAFTRHLLRLLSKKTTLKLTASNSDFGLSSVLDRIEDGSIDCIELYTWSRRDTSAGYKFYGIRFFFSVGVLDVEGHWTFDGSHQSELKGSFWEPLEAKQLLAISHLRDGAELAPLSYNRLKFCEVSYQR